MLESSYLMLYYFQYKKRRRNLKRMITHDINDTYPINYNSKKYENPMVKRISYSIASDAETVVFNPKPKHHQ